MKSYFSLISNTNLALSAYQRGKFVPHEMGYESIFDFLHAIVARAISFRMSIEDGFILSQEDDENILKQDAIICNKRLV